MNQLPIYQEPYPMMDTPIYPPYIYQPIVPHQPQVFLKQRLIGPKLATTLRTAQKGITTMTKIIPLIYQIQPVLANAKTVFKVAKAMNSISQNETQEVQPVVNEDKKTESFPNPYLP